MHKQIRFSNKIVKIGLSLFLVSGLFMPYATQAKIYTEDTATAKIEQPNEETKDQRAANVYDDVEVTFKILDEHGEYKEISQGSYKDVEHGTTLQELGVAFPDGSTKYENLKFVEWVTSDGKTVTKDTEITHNGYLQIYAKYDKLPITIVYEYPDNNLNRTNIHEQYIVSYGTTYKQFIQSVNDKNIADMYRGETFDQWQVSGSFNLTESESIEDEIQFSNRGFYLYAHYKNKIAAVTFVQYYDEKGLGSGPTKVKFVPEGTTYEALRAELKKQAAPKSFKGLRFKEWEIDEEPNKKGVVKDYSWTNVSAKYENYMVTFILDDAYRPTTRIDNAYRPTRGVSGGATLSPDVFVYGMVAEPGEVIKTPTFSDTFKNVTWTSDTKPGDTITVNSDLCFSGYGDKLNAPDIPNTGDSTVEVNANNPQSVIDAINSGAKNISVNIPVGVDTIPSEVFQAAIGKDVSLYFVGQSENGERVSYNFDKGIDKAVDFKVGVNTSTDNKMLKDLGDAKAAVFEFEHSGDLPGKMEVYSLIDGYDGNDTNDAKVYLLNEQSGKLELQEGQKANISYVLTEGKEKGYFNFTIDHCSTYVVSDKEIPADKLQVASPKDGVIKSTGIDANNVGNITLILSVIGGVAVLFATRKKGRA